jgi:hypothetical protein
LPPLRSTPRPSGCPSADSEAAHARWNDYLGSAAAVEEFLRTAFDRVNVRLMSTLLVDRYLRVDDHVQVPGSLA